MYKFTDGKCNHLLQQNALAKCHFASNTHTTIFTALWTLSGTTRLSRYQKVHFAIFWILWSKMKITQADAPTIWMDCHPFRLNGAPTSAIPQFLAGCPSLHNPPNLSWLWTGTKYAGLHTRWLGLLIIIVTYYMYTKTFPSTVSKLLILILHCKKQFISLQSFSL